MLNLGMNEECGRLLELAEAFTAEHLDLKSVEELSAALPMEEREHLSRCEDCREAVGDLLEARELFQAVGSQGQIQRPWFAARVMAAIAAKEQELTEVTKTWLAVPRFASRLALASAALLVLTSTWIYERPRPAVNPQSTSLEAQESLFESAPAAHQDDILVPAQDSTHE